MVFYFVSFKHTKIRTFTSGMYICKTSRFGPPSTRKTDKLEQVQQTSVKMVRSEAHCEERLKEFGFFSLEKEKLRKPLIQ